MCLPTVKLGPEPRDPIDRTLGLRRAGQPLGIEQYGLGADAAHALVNAGDASLEIGRINRQLNLAGIGAILGRRDWRYRRTRAWVGALACNRKSARRGTDYYRHDSRPHALPLLMSFHGTKVATLDHNGGVGTRNLYTVHL